MGIYKYTDRAEQINCCKTGILVEAIITFYRNTQKCVCFNAYISVLVGSHSYKLVLWEGEALSLPLTADVLHSVLRHLHDV